MKKKTVHIDKTELECLFVSLKNDGLVRVSGLGVFTIRRIKGRKFFNNMLNQETKTRDSNRLHFRPFTKVKEKVQKYV